MQEIRLSQLAIFRKIVLVWLLGIVFESVLSSTHDIHRIVFKTHHRRVRDHDTQKYHSDHHHTRKPPLQESRGETWPAVTTKTSTHYNRNNYRFNRKNESNAVHKREKSFKPLNIADIVEITTAYPEKLPVPLIQNTFQNYYRPPLNNSLDLYSPGEIKQDDNHINFVGRVRQLREKATVAPKNSTKGYEVYEEIIGDISPPPVHSFRFNDIQSLPTLNTPLPVVTLKDEDNHLKENVSESTTENDNKTYTKRTKSRRNRGNIRFN